MNRLIAWFTDNPIAANLMMISIMIGGFMSIPHINKEFFPSTPMDIVQIRTVYPGAAPINVEEQVCIRIENTIADLSGIEKITSEAKQDLCDIRVETEDNYDFQTLLNDIKTRVDALDTLPDTAEEPQVSQLIMNHEMMYIALQGNVDESSLKEYADVIKKEMEALPYVSTISIDGTRNYEIGIEVSKKNLHRYQLAFSEIESAIDRASIDIPVGKIRSPQGDIELQTRDQAYTANDFGNIIVRKDTDGTILRVNDIATVTDGFTEDPIISRFNGLPGIFLKVLVSNNPDVLKTNASVMQYIEQKNLQLPESMQLIVWHDFSVSFRDRIKTLVTNGASGLVLVFILLMLFLRPMLALWVTIGIGISFLGALWIMPSLGSSLNMLSLFAFLLILGIIVDDAIIVGESIYSEQQKHGITRDTAVNGAQRVSKPILYAVASTMLVFVPMIFLPGQSAEAAKAIPIVVLLCLSFSLVESLFILPTHLSDMPPEGHLKHPLIKRFDALRHICSEKLDWLIRKVYSGILDKTLRQYGNTIAVFIAALFIVLAIFIGGWMKYSFLPNVTTDYIRLEISLPVGEPFQLSVDVSARIESSAKDIQEMLIDNDAEQSHISNYMVRTHENRIYGTMALNRSVESTMSSPQIIDLWREKIGPISQAESIDFYYDINTNGKPLQYVLAAENNNDLLAASQLLEEYLKKFPGVFDIQDSLQTPRSELEFSIKPSSELSFWNIQALGSQLRNAFYGKEIQRIPRNGEDIRVMLRLDSNERTLHENINDLPVIDDKGNLTRLDAITDISYKPALQNIKRINRQRTVIVSANLLKGTTDSLEISDDIMENFSLILARDFPGVSVNLEGSEEERREFMAAWGVLFLQTMIAIYAMMAIAFRSYWQPVIILTAIPFGAMGAILGHLIMGREISIFSFLGLLACAGVVVNDNLVLIDRINQLRANGMKRFSAIHQAGIDRFRPIILTSATTFVGLIPIMSETSLQAQFLIPMVISLAFGVLFATGVTLILVPSLYMLGENCHEIFANATTRIKQTVKK